MLVSRQASAERSDWSIDKIETALPRSPHKLRMSNPFGAPLSTQTDWQGQYSFLPSPAHSNIFQQPYDHVATHSSDGTAAQAQNRAAVPLAGPGPGPGPSAPSGIEAPKPVPPPSLTAQSLGLLPGLGPLGLREPRLQAPPIHRRLEAPGEQYAQKAADMVSEEPLCATTELPGMSMGSHSLGSVSSAGHGGPDSAVSPPGNEEQVNVKEEDEDVLDDDEMLEGEGEGDGTSTQPQTAAERTAQRKKMKRFRLTHQQTRYLTSEFAKQPHPDAAHRESLSRQIPGLSPRQVQVWFQNRRAKLKRLAADDRERVIKMRAVPDDFDNVQALHSPYGAVHGLPAIPSPVEFGNPSYADPMLRPLMVDVRRSDNEDALSPTGLSPAFGAIGFNSPVAVSGPDVLSPMSTTAPNDRYGYGGNIPAPLSAGAGPPNPFARQGALSLDTAIPPMHRHPSAPQSARSLQPLQLRETMNRSRSDTLQSPLRSSMSWKGDTLDYTSYNSGGGGSPTHMGGRPPQPVYGSDQMSNSSSGGLGGYEPTSYSAASTVQSPTAMSYASFPPPSLQQQQNHQQQQQNRSRLRAASATFPLSLDLRTQYRPTGGPPGSNNGQPQQPQQQQQQQQQPGPLSASRAASTPQLGGYSASFASAPLTAPTDFALPRTPGFRPPGSEYAMPQMSAPMAPPHDFSQAFHAATAAATSATSTPTGNNSNNSNNNNHNNSNNGGGHMTSPSSRTPMRDSFSSGGHSAGLGQPPSTHDMGANAITSTDARGGEDYARGNEPSVSLGTKRKYSFSGPLSAGLGPAGTGGYGGSTA